MLNLMIDGQCCKSFGTETFRCKVGLHLYKKKTGKKKKLNVYIKGMGEDSVLNYWKQKQSQKPLERSGGCGRSVIE